MAQELINIGNFNDDGTGDNLREGGRKINSNFTELYDRTRTIIKGVVAGDGISVNYSPTSGIATINNTRLFQAAFAEIIIPKPGSSTDVWSIKANGASAILRLNAGNNVVIAADEFTDSITVSAVWPESFSGPTLGLHTGNVIGNVTGDVNGDLIGDVYALNGTSKVLESGTNGLNAIFYGSVEGNVEGNVIGNLRGNVIGNVAGNVSGNAGSVTNGIYTTDIGSVTNLMLAGSIQNSKLVNSSITINSQSVALGGSMTIPEYQLPNASVTTLGGIKVGDSLQINAQSGVLTTIQDIRTTASPSFAAIAATGNITIGGTPVNSNHAATKRYVDNSIQAIPPYLLPIAEPNLLGGIKVGTGLSMNQATGVLSTAQDISTTASPTFLSMTVSNSITLSRPPTSPAHATTKQYVDAVFADFEEYTLPYASETQLGGVRIGPGIVVDSETGEISTVQDIRTTATPTFSSIIVPNSPTINTHLTNKAYVDEQIATIPIYILPVASATILGGVRVGASLQIDAGGVLSTSQDIRTTANPTFTSVLVSSAPTQASHLTNKAYVDGQIAAIPPYILPVASATILGGVKVGASLQIDAGGVLSTSQDVRTTANPTFTSVLVSTAPTQASHLTNKAYVDGQIAAIPPYILPVASATILGGVKVGNSLQIDAGGALSTSQDIRTTANTTFNSLSVSTQVVLPNAPTQNNHAANKEYVDARDSFPIGGIIMWSGATTAIPVKWAICDGANGTPDLRNRFVIGAGSTYPVGSTGGSLTANFTVSTVGGHSHGGAAAPTTLSIAQMPSHAHRIIDTSAPSPNQDTVNSFDTDTFTNQNLGSYVDTTAVGGNQPHTHGISVDGAHNHTVTGSIVPPYYALAYIMKIS